MARRRSLACAAAALLWSAAAAAPARAQLGGLSNVGGKEPVRSDQPVTFTADSVQYDRDNAVVTAEGHVEAWQNDNVLRADKVTFDRNTDVAAASGHVVLLEPDGQVLFADYAELSAGMKDGVLRGMRAQLAQNGKLAANGARRTGGLLNELSKVVYSTCNVCVDDPSKPPFWQMRASSAVEDKEHQRIEFTDATLEMFGQPVAYFPYFSNADPSAKRQSGFLIPSVGVSSFLGVFLSVPYYLVLDDQSDVTITPTITTEDGPQIDLNYRRRFNDGELSLNASAGDLSKRAATQNGQTGGQAGLQGSVFAKGRFSLDDNWRYGFDIDRASSVNYLLAYSLSRYLGSVPDVLTSSIFVEGFGQGAYVKLDSRFYQSLTTSLSDTQLPVVLPRFTYSYFGAVDSWGGRLSADAGAFNVLRTVGTNTRRASLGASYDLPFTGELGDQWRITLHGEGAAYDFDKLGQQPNFGEPPGSGAVAQALPQAAVMFRWPFVRDSGSWGQQILEPIVQGVAAPNAGNSQFTTIPNEDSVDLEFTDANLFALNRFPGVDRLEGGSRVDAALHSTWYLAGTALDAMVGQSYQTEVLPFYVLPKSGLNTNVSDIVGHVSFTPTDWFDVTYRTRLDKSTYQIRLADVIASIGGPKLALGVGYLRSSTNPYTLFSVPATAPNPAVFVPRDEGTLSANSKLGEYRVSAYARRNLSSNKMVAVGASASYENECYILDVIFSRLYTSIDNQGQSTSVLLQMTFKSVGQFGFHAF